MVLIDFLDKGIARFADREAVRDGDAALTYRELRELVDRIASALIGEGLAPGSRVAIYSPNHYLAFAAQYGAIRAGCVWVPINFRNAPADMAQALASFQVEWLFFHSTNASHVQAVRDGIPSLKGGTCVDPVEGLEDLYSWASRHEPVKTFGHRTSPDTVALLTTSGTTGRPKGIVVSNRAFCTMITTLDLVLPDPSPPVHLVVAPLSHAAGIYAMALLARGGTQVIAQKADPLGIMEAIQRHRITTVFLPPTIIYMMLAHPRVREFDFSSLRSLIYGSAPMSVQKLREAVDIFGPVLFQGFGQSEALMVCTILSFQDHIDALADPAKERRLQSAGRESPTVRVEIMGEAGEILDAEQRGEIVVRGDIVMDGYFENPEATAEASQHGWHHTGDIGFKDADGFVYIVDRKKDMIITGGFNVFPGEVEQVLLGHPDVKDCAVVGVPDAKWGEAVLAAIELKPGAHLGESEMIAYCKDRLGSIKAPKTIIGVECLPRSANGKVLRREVRAPYWTGRDRQV